MLGQRRKQRRQRAIRARGSASDDLRERISAFVKSDVYSKYLQKAVFVEYLSQVMMHVTAAAVHDVHMFGTCVTAAPTPSDRRLFLAVDAGYSGDWSRIGAISKETEDSLKQALPLLSAAPKPTG